MSEEHLRVVEIGGVKMEVDTRTARVVDRFKVGDRVKVLVKSYCGWDSHHGVIVAFDEFKNLPTITVAYIDGSSLKFVGIHAENEAAEICACNDDVLVEKAEILAQLDAEITCKTGELDDLQRKRVYFETRFGALFES